MNHPDHPPLARLALDLRAGLCRCGCGGQTRRALWLAGHNNYARQAILNAHHTGHPMTLRLGTTEVQVSPVDAVDAIDTWPARPWSRWFEQATR